MQVPQNWCHLYLHSSCVNVFAWSVPVPSLLDAEVQFCLIAALCPSVSFDTREWRSRRPERKRAGSSTSGRFVAAITCIHRVHLPRFCFWRCATLIFSSDENPSSWLRSSSIVRCTSRSPDCSPPKRFVPMASSSSMKTIAPLLLPKKTISWRSDSFRGTRQIWFFLWPTQMHLALILLHPQ